MTAPLTTPAKAQSAEHALSPSQVSTFLDCAARWYFAKVLQIDAPANGALALGHAVHRTTAGVMRGKGATGALCTLTEALEILDAVWPDELGQAELAPDESADKLATYGRKIVAKWHTQIAPELEPVAVEMRLSGKIGGISVNSIVDLVDARNILIDLKTAAKKPGRISSDYAFQLATYGVLAGIDHARLITITKAESPQIVSHTLEIGEEDRRHVEAIYPLVSEAMQSGIYPPRRTSHLCSRKHCPFWRQCVAEFGGAVA